MDANVEFNSKLYEILTTIQYNGERREILEDVLRIFLIRKDSEMNIRVEAGHILEKKKSINFENIMDKKELLKSEWFKEECVLLSNTPSQYIPEYISQKFSPFSTAFKQIYRFDMNILWLFAFKLLEYIEFKKYMTRFTDEVYKFKSENEYADLGFIAKPPKNHIEKWKNIVTLSISEIERVLSGVLSTHEIEEVLKILSINQGNLPNGIDGIRFPSTPLLQVDEDTIILLTPWYLATALPSLYENLFKKCRSYLDSKGKSFEKLAQNSLKLLPFEGLAFNVFYGNGFETDAILGFKKSFWVVEVTSHPPSLKSLKGDITSINRDLKKTIKKCIRQGKKCLEHVNESCLTYFSKNAKVKGILIIVDGVYPQLNMNTAINFFEEKIPIYVINWFDLKTLIDQIEIGKFEEFLLWRTQQPMPVICFDEKDYWAYYFDKYALDKKMRKAFETVKEKENKLFYVSYRFNNKECLEKLTGRC